MIGFNSHWSSLSSSDKTDSQILPLANKIVRPMLMMRLVILQCIHRNNAS